MANEITVQAPRIGRLPPWFVSLENSKLRIEEGTYILPTPITTDQRAWLEAQERSFRSTLATLASPREVAGQVARLRASFPSQTADDRIDDIATRDMIGVLSEFTAWAIADAVGMWFRRLHSDGSENYAFPPSLPQMVRLCRLAMEPTRAEYGRVRMVLAARVEEPPPSPEERERVTKMLDEFLRPQVMPGSEA